MLCGLIAEKVSIFFSQGILRVGSVLWILGLKLDGFESEFENKYNCKMCDYYLWIN